MESWIPRILAAPTNKFLHTRSKFLTVLLLAGIVLGFTLPAQAATYTVQPGDTLWLIGQRFGVSVEEIQQASGIGHDLLYPGDILTIPEHGSVTSLPSRGGIRPSAQETELLARMIMAEAGSEPYLGKVAVGAVIVNRLAHPSFPKTLTGVLYETYAFEPVLNGTFYSVRPNSDCLRAAVDALSGVDPTGGALYFYNPRTAWSPWVFSRPVVTQIGNHVFAK